MKGGAWPTFSFTECLTPPPGWKTDAAILSTYSADLVVIVTALLALSGCDTEGTRKGSRVELVKAIEALRGRVRVLTQAGRVVVPNAPTPVLKLLDRFVTTRNTDEEVCSWHPKLALMRYCRIEDPDDRQWRLWLGSRNLTRALNWDAGMVLISRGDGGGQRIAGLSEAVQRLAAEAKLSNLSRKDVATQFSELTWECPDGCTVHRISLLGPELSKGFPHPASDTERVIIVSPFLDKNTVRAGARWGDEKTRRVLVSTSMELQRLLAEDPQVFTGYDIRMQPLPELPAECAHTQAEEAAAPPSDSDESEDVSPAGLHAKLLYAARGTRRQLWLGSANATERGWGGRNFEIVAEMSIGRDTATAIEDFAANCERFSPRAEPPTKDKDEDALEKARKLLSGQWALAQRIIENRVEVWGPTPPPLRDSAIQLEAATLGGSWICWPRNTERLALPLSNDLQRSDFVQLRITRGNRVCSWIQAAPCDPPPDEARDRTLIGQYLDARTFLLWLRSLLAEQPAEAGGGDWDVERSGSGMFPGKGQNTIDLGFIPTLEEILRSWARGNAAFKAADDKVAAYLTELERRAADQGAAADSELLQRFRRTWTELASELR